MSARKHGAQSHRLVLGTVAATAAAITARELIGVGSKPVTPGRLVHLDGGPQHVVERRGARRPTIVFESGLGNPVTMWAWLFRHLPEETHFVGYDRPGVGWSRPITGSLDSSRYPEHLLSLLEAAGAPPPYLLVGHSLGGLLIRLFAERQPQLTAGLVFVDATHPAELLTSSWLDGSSVMQDRLNQWMVRATLGMPVDEGLTAELASLPPSLTAATVKAKTRAGSLRAARRELGLSREWAASCDRAGFRAPCPVAVVTATVSLESRPEFAGYQDDLVRLSDVGRAHFVVKATHNSLLTDREHAAKVAEAVVWVLDRAPHRPVRTPRQVSRNGRRSA
ncbi:MAG TPA: alpha/beta hydrolase [Amycolatopsis sp.]|uniref:alpha/beta hydrolase n=1 Tax=Amycolatopsis sp. TaxID=37632 RepID=UPI002B477D91|nr:alpha/beta hydrolase [Amycolatopsis sp.]HKS45910.1 alpha/beta hydrolase [Amycolatopsis sp.]